MIAYDAILQSWAVQALVASTLLMAGVLLVRRPAQRLFGARIAYALWALPALRLMLPRIPGWDADRFRVALDVHHTVGVTFYEPAVVIAAPLPALPPPDPAIPIHAASLLPPLPMPATIDWPSLLLWAWLGGAGLHFGWHMLAHRRFMARALQRAEPVTKECGIAVLSGPRIAGPLATGLVRRLVLLPGDFTRRYSPRERRLVLAHEIAHHVRGDLVANMAALAVLSLHWFNPLAHRAWRAFRQDQELACDETVLAHEPATARADYGLAVVKSASRAYPAAACAMHPVGLLKRRLRMMTRRPGRARRSAGAALGLALAAAGLIGTASGGLAADAVRGAAARPAPAPDQTPRRVRVEDNRITVDGREVPADTPEGRRILASLPLPPVPPVAPIAPVAPLAPVTPVAPLAPVAPVAPHAAMMLETGRVFIDGREGPGDSSEGRWASRAAARASAEGARAAIRAQWAARGAPEAQRAAAESARAAVRAEWAGRSAREAQRASIEGARAAAEAGAMARRVLADLDIDGIVAHANAAARASLAATCAGPGRRGCVDAAAVRAEVRRSLDQARIQIARSLADSARERQAAMAELDAELARMGDEGR